MHTRARAVAYVRRRAVTPAALESAHGDRPQPKMCSLHGSQASALCCHFCDAQGTRATNDGTPLQDARRRPSI